MGGYSPILLLEEELVEYWSNQYSSIFFVRIEAEANGSNVSADFSSPQPVSMCLIQTLAQAPEGGGGGGPGGADR